MSDKLEVSRADLRQVMEQQGLGGATAADRVFEILEAKQHPVPEVHEEAHHEDKDEAKHAKR